MPAALPRAIQNVLAKRAEVISGFVSPLREEDHRESFFNINMPKRINTNPEMSFARCISMASLRL